MTNCKNMEIVKCDLANLAMFNVNFCASGGKYGALYFDAGMLLI